MRIYMLMLLFAASINICSGIPFQNQYEDHLFLEPPLPIIPLNLAIHISLTPYFDWKTVGGEGTQYELQVTTMDDLFFLKPLIDIDGITESSYQVTSKNILSHSITYIWRVRAKCGHDSSIFSLIFIFVTQN